MSRAAFADRAPLSTTRTQNGRRCKPAIDGNQAEGRRETSATWNESSPSNESHGGARRGYTSREVASATGTRRSREYSGDTHEEQGLRKSRAINYPSWRGREMERKRHDSLTRESHLHLISPGIFTPRARVLESSILHTCPFFSARRNLGYIRVLELRMA